MAKIVHLTSVHPLHDNRILYRECSTIAAKGHDVTLVLPHDADCVVNGVRIRAVPRPRNRVHRFTSTLRQIYRLAREEKADLYHIHDPELLPVAQLLVRLDRAKVIYDMHENVPQALLAKPYIAPPLRKLVAMAYRPVERLLLRGLPVIFAELSYASHYRFITQSTTVLNMPDVEGLASVRQAKYDCFTAGYIGRISPYRGSTVMLQALHILQQRHVDVALELVGAGVEEWELELRRRAQQFDLQHLHLHGYLPPVEGWEIMARCHVGLAVLQNTPNYVDSYPTKLFEYMSLGLPVIVSDFPLYREVVIDAQCGFCVDPDDPVDLANALEWIFRNPDEAATMGKRGRAAVQAKYNWATEAERLLAFYDQVLHSS